MMKVIIALIVLAGLCWVKGQMMMGMGNGGMGMGMGMGGMLPMQPMQPMQPMLPMQPMNMGSAWENFGNAFKDMSNMFKDMKFIPPWYQGANVCYTEELRPDPFAEEHQPKQDGVAMRSCRESGFKYVCVARGVFNGIEQERVRTYECCPGSSGVLAQDGKKCVPAAGEDEIEGMERLRMHR